MVGHPMFAPIQHPQLAKLGRRNIVKFLDDYENYVLRSNEAVQQGSQHKPVSMVLSVTPKLLKSLIRLGTFGKVSSVDSLTDEILEKWLRSKTTTPIENRTKESLEADLRKNVYINTREEDPELRIISLFADYDQFLVNRNMQEIVKDNPKLAVQHICLLLKPVALRNKVEADLSIHRAALKKDFTGFFKYVCEEATNCDKYVPVWERKEFKRSESGNPAATTPKANSGQSSHTSSGSTSKDNVARQPPFCLNKATCPNERHYMKNCTKSTDAVKKKLIKEFRENKPSAIKQLRNERDDGRIDGLLMDKVSVTVSGDYGADHAALSAKHIKLLAADDIFVPILTLQTPVVMELAVDGKDAPLKVVAKQKARVSTTLRTPQGPMRLKNIEYLVMDNDMSDVLLSRPILQSLGFNLDSHLARIKDKFHDVDMSHISFDADHELETKHANASGSLSRILLAQAQHEVPQYLDEDVESGAVQAEHSRCTETTAIERTHLDLGKHVPADVDVALQQQLTQAKENGLDGANLDRLHSLVRRYADIFRLKLGSDPPVKIKPMVINLEKECTPFRAKPRRYSVEQLEFLDKKVKELESLGLIYKNNNSSWACAPHIVPKAGSEKWRFTVDLRPVNKVTVPIAWPMPQLEQVVARMSGQRFFASLDLCQGYWQLPLSEESQSCQSFITPKAVYSPTRVMHGQKNATAFCQSAVQDIFGDIEEQSLLWLDDMVVHESEVQLLLDVLEQAFALCEKYGLKLHAKKCQLFLTQVRWCGRIVDGNGVRMDPSRLSALLNMQPPTKGSELQQLVCSANWMRTAIPEFTKLISPLATLLEDVYSKAGKRTRKASEKVELSEVGWEEKHAAAFTALKNALRTAVQLSHPDQSKLFCLFTDASEDHWSGVLTQISPNSFSVPFIEQEHEPLAFLAGSFTGSSYNWSTLEKEAAAIINSVQRLDYLLIRPKGFYLFTDHSNLVFIFNPERVQPSMSKNATNKVKRWAIALSVFDYTIAHIDGEENVWADLLSRWGNPDRTNKEGTESGRKHLHLSRLFRAPVAPEFDDDFQWPQHDDIVSAQKSITSEIVNMHELSMMDGIWKTTTGATYIPEDATHLQLRLCVVGHFGRGGHRGLQATQQSIMTHFYWNHIKEDITTFHKSCLHCLSTNQGPRVTRPLGHAMHSTSPNELIHFDFIYMNESYDGQTYVLMIKDDASSYAWLIPSITADAKAAATGLVSWFSAFGVVETWISDRGTHFKNTLMAEISKRLHAHHSFTAPNAPHTNGTVERLGREVLRATRALLSEVRLNEKEWPSALPVIQSIINHTPRKGLGNRAPITVFTGLPPDNPLRLVLKPVVGEVRSVEEVQATRVLQATELEQALDDIHRDVSIRRTKAREEAVKRHNEKTNVKLVNFSTGDYVLVAKRQAKDGRKLQVQWHGPQQIAKATSDNVFEVKDLLTGKTSLVHSNRLKFYADSQLSVTQELLDTVSHNAHQYNEVEQMLDLQYNRAKREWEVQVKWIGFDHEEPTWELLQNMHEDVPELLDIFLNGIADQQKVARARNSLRRLTRKGSVTP